VKSEKEILAEFTALVFNADECAHVDTLSKESLLKGALTSVRLAANDALEVSSNMPKSAQAELDRKMLAIGLPSLLTLQNKAFRDFRKIANRGSIKKEQEYRLVRSVSETGLLNQAEQLFAYDLIENYEQTRT
jgi:hypothetical protein|tara:strand:+ start:3694 stop:4092 length:399 start_codon:yes stop_codon:yes gene_type:complete